MRLEIHLEKLRSRHLALSEEVMSEQQRPAGCGLRINELKRQKLKLKETILKINRKLLTL